MARTIDNLGLDISTRYATDREGFDEALVKESRSIPSQTRIATTLPSYASEFELLFDLGKRGIRWALFKPPAQYYASRRRLFAEQLIPDLGTPDLQETQIERLEAIGDEEKKKQKNPEKEAEVDEEKKILLKLLNNIHSFDQILIEINSRRSQYQKG